MGPFWLHKAHLSLLILVNLAAVAKGCQRNASHPRSAAFFPSPGLCLVTVTQVVTGTPLQVSQSFRRGWAITKTRSLCLRGLKF